MEIKATHHTIKLKIETCPIQRQPFRTSIKSLEVLCEHIDTQLESGVIKPALLEGITPIVLISRKDDTLRFQASYLYLNAPRHHNRNLAVT